MTKNEQTALEQALTQLGVPTEKIAEMAVQLDKRAHQLAEAEDRTYEQSLIHLLQLMKNARDERDKQND